MANIKIGNKTVGYSEPVLVIAEVSLNHNRDINIAKRLIDAASGAGCDVVKFQTFMAEGFISDRGMTYKYMQNGEEKVERQFDMFKRLELPFEWHKELKEYAEGKGLIFMSTPGDEKCADFLEDLGAVAFKIGSDDLTNLRLVEHIAKKNKPIIISTGMSTMEEIDDAVNVIYATGNKNLAILHCSSEYPARAENINLKVIGALKKRFGVPIGFSDHSVGINIAIAAIGAGACVIEKHITLDKRMEGPDHSFSLEPNELVALVRAIREAGKAVGVAKKSLTAQEVKMKQISRKTIVASRFIKKGEVINSNLAVKRANGIGLEPKFLTKIIGKKAAININRDKPILQEYLVD